jgi:hypothetical protein
MHKLAEGPAIPFSLFDDVVCVSVPPVLQVSFRSHLLCLRLNRLRLALNPSHRALAASPSIVSATLVAHKHAASRASSSFRHIGLSAGVKDRAGGGHRHHEQRRCALLLSSLFSRLFFSPSGWLCFFVGSFSCIFNAADVLCPAVCELSRAVRLHQSRLLPAMALASVAEPTSLSSSARSSPNSPAALDQADLSEPTYAREERAFTRQQRNLALQLAERKVDFLSFRSFALRSTSVRSMLPSILLAHISLSDQRLAFAGRSSRGYPARYCLQLSLSRQPQHLQLSTRVQAATRYHHSTRSRRCLEGRWLARRHL